LIKNPHFIYQNTYNKIWAQPQLRYGENVESFVIPDFVTKSTVTGQSAIMDLKLPFSSGLVKKRALELTKRLLDAVEQVLNYKTITDSSLLSSNLAGEIYSVDDVCIVIGRFGEEIEAARGILANEELQRNTVKLIAYNDLIEVQRNVLEGIVFLGKAPG
jgi:hypothetical protein